MGVFDILLGRGRPRGVRPELPSAIPGSSIFRTSGQWGDIPLPLAAEQTVLGLPAANRAVLLISNAVATMSPLQAWGADGFLVDDAKTPSILVRPNSVYTCFDFVQMACAMALMRGNHLSLKADFNAAGYPQQLVPVPTGRWIAYYDGAGYLVYAVGGKTYSRDEVFHVRASASPDSPMGVGVVEQFRRSIGHQLDQQNMAADTYRSGSVPSGVINLDLPEVDVDQATAVQTQWIQNHSSGARAPAVLPNTMHFEAIQWSPEDLQFLDARMFSVGEMAHMFNLDPTDLGASFVTGTGTQTYANIEQRQTSRLVDSYGPWMRRFEEEFSDCIPGPSKAKMVPANLLRTDSKTRAEVDQLEIANETLTPDEARKRDGKKPLPKPKAPAPGAVGPDGKPAAPALGPDGTPTAAGPVPSDPNIVVKPPSVKL